MGRQKLLLDLRGKPVVRWSAERLAAHVHDLIVVTGHDADAVRAALADVRAALSGVPLRFTTNPRPEDGQGTSIACGAAEIGEDVDAAFVALGDQPAVPDEVFRRLRAALGPPRVAPGLPQGALGAPRVAPGPPQGALEPPQGALGPPRVSIVAPVYRGTQGTPVLFAADVFAELRTLAGDTGARPVVMAEPQRVHREVFDVTMPDDVDTPEDYARLV
jgi:molybdenum cofactor cytidylyltransferase